MIPTLGTLAVFIGNKGDSGLWWGILISTNSLVCFLGSIVSCSLSLFLSNDNVFYVAGIIGIVLMSPGLYGAVRRLKGDILRG